MIRGNTSFLKPQNELRFHSEMNAKLKPGAGSRPHRFLVVCSQAKRGWRFFFFFFFHRHGSSGSRCTLDCFCPKKRKSTGVKTHTDLNTFPCILSSQLHFEVQSPALKNNVWKWKCRVALLESYSPFVIMKSANEKWRQTKTQLMSIGVLSCPLIKSLF